MTRQVTSSFKLVDTNTGSSSREVEGMQQNISGILYFTVERYFSVCNLGLPYEAHRRISPRHETLLLGFAHIGVRNMS